MNHSIGRWCARAVVTALAGSLLATAQPLPAVRDVYSSDRASRLGPEAQSTPLDRWAGLLREASFVRYDFRLRIEHAGQPPTEASGRADLKLDGGRTVDFRILIAETGISLVPAGTSLVRIAKDATARTVYPEQPTDPLDRIARHAADLPLPGADDPPATETAPSVLHFARGDRDEHVYLHFADGERFPVKIERVADGPTHIVLEIEIISLDAR